MTAAILQARMGSTRLPGKMLLPIIDGRGALELMLERVSAAQTIDRIVVATTTLVEDEPLVGLCEKLGVSCYRGDSANVLDRYYQCARTMARDHVLVRLTGDCPLHDSAVIDRVVGVFHDGQYDYVANTHPPTFPDGLDTEVFSFAALERAWQGATLLSEREHVTYYLYTHPELFRLGNLSLDEDLSSHRWTLDEPADLEFIRQVYAALYPAGKGFGMYDVLAVLKARPELLDINQNIVRNAGLAKSLEQDRKLGNIQ
jgi:spore coat polysaccharide biosynthesis protein SpsF